MSAHRSKPAPRSYVSTLSRLYGDAGEQVKHFDSLTRNEQRAAIKRMSADGMSDHTIAADTRLSVEQIRAIIGERNA